MLTLEDGNRNVVLSNVNDSRLEQLLDVIEHTDSKNQFLDRRKELVVVERNPRFLYKFLDEVLPYIMPHNCKYVTGKEPVLPHHMVGVASIINYLNTEPREWEPREIIARVKGPDSLVEKITRILGTKSKIADEASPRRLFVEDVYGINVICKTEEECYQLCDKLLNFSSLMLNTEDDYFGGSVNGYRALHNTFSWHNGVSAYNGLRIKVHYVTSEEHLKNQHGTLENPGRAHEAYSMLKLLKPHKVGNRQIVVVDHVGDLRGGKFSHRFVPLSCPELKGEAHYHLLRPEYN